MHLGIATRKGENSFQHTVARRRLPTKVSICQERRQVSTHSRTGAAAPMAIWIFLKIACFNTQPPEGDCRASSPTCAVNRGFNTQPRGGGCAQLTDIGAFEIDVSTHSRPKVAACDCDRKRIFPGVSTHSRPKVAADYVKEKHKALRVSTHSRAEAAAIDHY